jgi:3-hydroxyisobutyrate dehydrogenase-like beta-hydroxyacid dehydrogenase
MHVAVIGLGEVGRCFAEPLLRAGYQVSLCEARPSPAAVELAQKLALPIHPDAGEWLKDVDWVFCCVTGAVSLAVTKQVTAHLRQGAAIADFTTASPAVKREGAAITTKSSVRYVDVAIMGGILINRERTPLLVAGEGMDDFKAVMEKAGGRVKAIEGGAAGDAMSLKILRSVFTKGMEALAVELLMSAEKQGVRDKLYEQLLDIDQTPLRDFIEMLVRTHVVHAKRRAHEVNDAQGELTAQGMPSTVLPGVEERFHKTARALEAHPLSLPEPDIHQALDWLLANGR